MKWFFLKLWFVIKMAVLCAVFEVSTLYSLALVYDNPHNWSNIILMVSCILGFSFIKKEYDRKPKEWRG